MEKTIHRFDREGAERYVCDLSGAKRTMRIDLHHLEKFIAHQNAQHKGCNHGIKSPSGVAVITNQDVNCGSAVADRPVAESHVVKSGTRGSCKKDRSHGTWSLEEVTQPINCNLCAHEFGDLHVPRAHACLTHKPFPAPTIRASQHAHPFSTAKDATSNTQEMDTSAGPRSTKRDGVEAEEQRHRRQLRRTASRSMQDWKR